ncbi:MAG: hypothetical protein LBB87_03185 [Nitrososphaerota archaeon]|jgi:parallel beta-helix repeat protein|nr:hypothetical protein [Nitrososphaerota archaeon]
MNKPVAVLLALFLLLSVIVIQCPTVVTAQGSDIIRIKEDGSVTGTDKIQRNGMVYTLTGDLSGSVGQGEAFIFVERSDIVFNGAGYTLQGSGSGSGICLLRCQNVTVENFIIRGFSRGIDFWAVENLPSDSHYLSGSSALGNKIVNNKIEASSGVDDGGRTRDVGWCIYLNAAFQTVISGNVFTSQNPQGGVYLGNLTRNTSLNNNNFLGCRIFSLFSNHTVASGNAVDGKPLIYLDSKSDQVIDDAGLVYLFNCSNIVVKRVEPLYDYAAAIQLVDTVKSDISNNSGNVLLVNSKQNSVHNNKLTSLTLDASSYNKVFDNLISGSSVCVKLYGDSNFNSIYNNALLDTIYSVDVESLHAAGSETAAIQLGDPQFGGVFNNNLNNNTIINHDCAVNFSLSSNNTIAGNLLKDCHTGVLLGASHFNTFTENNITSCQYAVGIHTASSNNTFYYNNFINNTVQCTELHFISLFPDGETYSTGNTWDNGTIGNYWSTYTGIDTNGDGIGDTPYHIFEYMTDNYPLMTSIQTSTNLPQYDTTPTPPIQQPSLFNKDNLTRILIIGVIIGVISGLLIYFRRLIFR